MHSVSVPFWHQRNQIVHLFLFKLLYFVLSRRGWHILLVLLLFLYFRPSFQQIWGKLDHSNSSEWIAQQNYGVDAIECQVCQLRVFHRFFISQAFMLFYIQIINVNPLKSRTRKNSGWVWCPHNIYHNHTHIEKHYLGLRISRVPNSNCPIRRSRDKGSRMVLIPSDFVDCQ